MFSKKSIFIVILPFVFASCSDHLNGEKSKPQTLDMSDGSFACLKGLPETLQQLAEGNGKAENIETSVSCLERALKYFREETTGAYGNAYSGEDFRKFFGKFFLKNNNNVSASFMVEILKLKAALVGGATDIVTKEEISRIINVIGALRIELIALVPYQQLILVQQPSADNQAITEMIARLQASVLKVLKATDLYKSHYTFDDSKKFVEEFLVFIEKKNLDASMAKFKEIMPLVESLKNVVLGEQAVLSGFEDWGNAAKSFIEIFDLSLRRKYIVGKTEINNSEDARNLGDMFMRALICIENTHQMRTKGNIPVVQIDDLLHKLIMHKFFVSPVTEETLIDSYKMFFGRLGTGRHFSSPSDISNIDLPHIQLLRREVRVWRGLQNWVDSLASSSAVELPWGEVMTKMLAHRFDPDSAVLFQSLNDRKIERAEKENMQDSWEDFSGLLAKQLPVHFSRKGQFRVDPPLADVKTTWGSLSRANIVYSLTRMFLIGYSNSDDRRFPKMVLEEPHLVQWYDDFSKLGQELKAFHPSGKNSGSRSFLEANLFTFSGNGDREVSFDELYQFISMLVSAGLETINDFRVNIDSYSDATYLRGCQTTRLDIFKLPTYNEACFQRAIKEKYALIFSNLPRLVRQVYKSPKDFDTFYQNFLDAVRVSNPAGKEIEHDDIRVFVMMTHYLENIFAVYDVDRDNYLDFDEIEAAAPRFMGFIEGMTEIPDFVPNFLKKWVLKRGFVYLVTEGRRPSGWRWLSFIRQMMTSPVTDYFAEADRTKIAMVFRNLKDELKKK